MNKPIRVLHYIKHLETGGGETLIFNIYQHIDRSKVQFDFAVNTSNEERLDANIKDMGGTVLPIINKEPPFVLTKLVKTAAGLNKLLSTQQYDIVHIHCSNGQGLYYSNIAKKRGVRTIVCHIHNTSVVGRFLIIKTAVHKIFRSLFMNAPTNYLACSMAAANWLYDDNVINSNQFHILKNGIDVDKFKFSETDRAIIRGELGFNDNKVICTIGRCVKEKNQIFVLKVLEELLQQDQDYRLILIGQGELQDSLKQYAAKKDIDKKIVFINSTSEVEKYLSASDTFLLSSSSSEGLGIVAIEAQANGLQTIVSDNVPDDVLISPYVQKINLDKGEATWADAIRKWRQEYDREKAGIYIKKAGYEIQLIADELQDLYRNSYYSKL